MNQRVLTVNVSAAEPLDVGGRIVQSAYRKKPVTGPLAVGMLGLAGDAQADRRWHGGIGKAVYAYPKQHYEHWQTMRAQAGVADWGSPLQNGALGENLTIEGLTEGDVWIGDVLRFAKCKLAISDARVPCFKFVAVMGFPQAAKMMVQSGWCGFYLAVRETGTIEAGDEFEVIPGPRHIGIPERFASLMAGKRRIA